MGKKRGEVYQLKITLKGIKPPVWRRIQVPTTFNFNDLHFAIQDAMGWEDSHLHGFELVSPKDGTPELIGVPEDDTMGQRTIDEKKKKLSQYFGKGIEKAVYVYDYGDDWTHEIKLENIFPTDEAEGYPVCIAGKRACPPEDVGGIYGYLHMLDVLADPKSDEYDGLREWLDEDFDPERFSPAEVVFYDAKERERLGIEDDTGNDVEDAWDEDNVDDMDDGQYMEADDYPDEDEPANVPQDESVQELVAMFTSSEVRSLFERAKRGELSGLNDEQTILAVSLLENMEDVSFAMDILSDPERDADDEEDAVSVLISVIAQSRAAYQVKNKDPEEAFTFYQAMIKKGLDHSDILSVMADLYALSLDEGDDEGSLDHYKARLARMAKLTPKKILKELDKEFSAHGKEP